MGDEGLMGDNADSHCRSPCSATPHLASSCFVGVHALGCFVCDSGEWREREREREKNV